MFYHMVLQDSSPDIAWKAPLLLGRRLRHPAVRILHRRQHARGDAAAHRRIDGARQQPRRRIRWQLAALRRRLRRLASMLSDPAERAVP